MSYYAQKGDFYNGGASGYYQGDPFFGALLARALPVVAGFFKRKAPQMIQAAGPIAARVAGAVGRAVSRHPVLSAAGAAGTIGVLGGVGATRMSGAGTNALGGRGMHMIARGPHAGQATKNRRMHVTNVKALRRAIRRAHGFEKLARKVMGFSSPHKPKGRAYFKRKTRAR